MHTINYLRIECVHDGHVGGPKQYNDFPLGNIFYFYANIVYCFSPPTWPPCTHSFGRCVRPVPERDPSSSTLVTELPSPVSDHKILACWVVAYGRFDCIPLFVIPAFCDGFLFISFDLCHLKQLFTLIEERT